MTREEFFEKIRWPKIFTAIGILNPIVGIGQLWNLVTTGKHENVSMLTFALMFVVVAGFAGEGCKNRTPMAMWSMVAASAVNGTTVVLLYYLRYVR